MGEYYENYVKNRSKLAYYRGVVSRFLSHIKYLYITEIARRNGAVVGDFVTMPKSLAKKLNSNCIIGNHVSINTDKIDTRTTLKIGDHVIIGSGTEIITVSHNIDSTDWEPKYYGIVIEDYVWLANNSLILPSCRLIEQGAVIGAGSVVVKNVETMSVISGNPGKEIRKRINVHSDLPVERLLHGDYKIFKEIYNRH